MKGSITLSILKIISEAGSGPVNAADAFINSPYGASQSRLMYELRKRGSQRAKKDIEKQLQKNYQVILSKLKADGLIKTKDIPDAKLVSITKKGLTKLAELNERKKRDLPKTIRGPAEPGTNFMIVAFDIPEKQRKKRTWLRCALKEMRLTMLQRSVWMGKVKLPEEFIKSLHNLKLLNCVEIFEITNRGTLKHLG